MKVKGISWIELHAEKLVFGVFALGLLGVLAMQFLGAQTTVKVGKEDVPLADAYSKVNEEAKRVDARLKLSSPDGMPSGPDEAVKQLAQFDKAFRGPVAPAAQLVGALDAGSEVRAVDGPATAAAAPVGELKVPGPANAMAASYLVNVDPIEARDPAVAAVLPKSDPLDKAGVTVEATFSGTALKAALEADPDGAGPARALPKAWWDGIQILAVEIERQTMKDDGSWGPAEKVQPMPGRFSLVPSLGQLTTALTIKDAVQRATEDVTTIRRPTFYAARFGDKWLPVSQREAELAGEVDDKAAQIALAKRELEKCKADEKRASDALAKIGGAASGGSSSPSGGGGVGVGGGGGGGGHTGGGASAPAGGPSGPNRGEEQRKKALQNQIKQAQDCQTRAKQRLVELGETVEGMTPPPAPTPAPGTKSAGEGLLDVQNIKLWAHDVFVERGRVYRYRMNLVFNNPYFGHSAAMPQEQQALASSGVMRGPASDWTAPVRVDPETYVFFTSASEENAVIGSPATARAEVYQFRWGFWRRGTAGVEPGDAVMVEIRSPDLSKVASAATGGATGSTPTDRDPPPAAPAPAGGGRLGGGSGLSSPTGGSASPTTPTPDTLSGPAPIVKTPYATNSILLGVGTAPSTQDEAGKSRSITQVFLRDGENSVSVRTPEQERLDPAYKLVSKSADRGEEQMREKPKPRPNQAPPGSQPTDRDPPPSGGGSAGGRGG